MSNWPSEINSMRNQMFKPTISDTFVGTLSQYTSSMLIMMTGSLNTEWKVICDERSATSDS